MIYLNKNSKRKAIFSKNLKTKPRPIKRMLI